MTYEDWEKGCVKSLTGLHVWDHPRKGRYAASLGRKWICHACQHPAPDDKHDVIEERLYEVANLGAEDFILDGIELES